MGQKCLINLSQDDDAFVITGVRSVVVPRGHGMYLRRRGFNEVRTSNGHVAEFATILAVYFRDFGTLY